MECQPKVFLEAGLFDKLLGFRLDGVCKDNQCCKGGHVLLMGLDRGKNNITGKLNMLFQFLGSKIIANEEIYILMVLNCAEHMLLAYKIIFIAEKENQ